MLIHVAVGVIKNPYGEILIARRNEQAHQGGLWEFPGGKVEAGETVQQALSRELEEELGIQCQEGAMRELIVVEHDYGDKQVRLEVWWVNNFVGLPEGKEGQPLRWVVASNLTQFAFPAANEPIVQAILAEAAQA